MNICAQCGHPNDPMMGLGQCIHVLPEVVFKKAIPTKQSVPATTGTNEMTGWTNPRGAEKIPLGADVWIRIGPSSDPDPKFQEYFDFKAGETISGVRDRIDDRVLSLRSTLYTVIWHDGVTL